MSDDDGMSSSSSSSSMGYDPRTSSRYYSHLYKHVLKSVFPSILKKKDGTELPGINHRMFALNFDGLTKKSEWAHFPPPLEYDRGDEKQKNQMMALSTHIICNQYVRHERIKEAPWETLDSMAAFYEKGQLNRYAGKGVDPPASPSPEDIRKSRGEKPVKNMAAMMDDLSDDDSDEEELKVEEEKGVTVFDMLKENRVDALSDLAKKTEAVAFRMWKQLKGKEPTEAKRSVQAYTTYIYPDTDEARAFITEAIKSSLLKIGQKMAKRGRTTIGKDDEEPTKRQKTATPPSAAEIPTSIPLTRTSSSGENNVSGYLNTLFGNRGSNSNSDPGQVFWGDILQDINLEEAYLDSDDPVQMMKQTKMACGGMFASDARFKDRVPAKDAQTGFRKYMEKHRNDMVTIANLMKTALMQRKSASG